MGVDGTLTDGKIYPKMKQKVTLHHFPYIVATYSSMFSSVGIDTPYPL